MRFWMLLSRLPVLLFGYLTGLKAHASHKVKTELVQEKEAAWRHLDPKHRYKIVYSDPDVLKAQRAARIDFVVTPAIQIVSLWAVVKLVRGV